MSETIEVVKAESNPNSTDARLKLGEIGAPFIQAVGGYIQDAAKRELQYPESLATFDKMASNSAVSAGLTAGEVFLTKALLAVKFKEGVSGSQESKDFAAFLNWNINNFVGNSWYDAVTNIITFRKYGFAWLEKVFGKNDSQKWKGKYPYRYLKLAPRSQKSVREWVFDDPVAKRNLVGLVQRRPITAIGQSYYSAIPQISDIQDKYVRREKFMLFSWNSTNNNPQGKSDLYDCYKAWKEMEMINSYEVVGVSRDMQGTMVLRLPNDHINKATTDPNSDEAQTLKVLKRNAAAMANGDSTYVILGSDTQGENGNGKYTYDIEFKGIEGGGTKSYKTSELIEQRKKDILNILGASFLLVGQGDTGSHSLSDSSRSVHAFYMERMLMYISSVFAREFVKSLADINGLSLEEDDMPIMTFGELDEVDSEEASKTGQRLGATGLFPKEKSMLLQLWKKCGYDVTEVDKLSIDELVNMLTPETTRSGDGMSQGLNSGTGGANGSAGNASDMNSDNAA